MDDERITSLRGFIRNNAFFLYSFLIFLIAAGLLLGVCEQGDAILFFSMHRSSFGDLFFIYFTKMGEEIVFFAALSGLLFYRYRYAIVIPLLGISVSVFSFLFKEIFGHDRPSLYFRKLGTFDEIHAVEGVVLNGGANSFPSGHTMAAFALYAFLAFCLPRKKGTALVIFLVALLVGISRIYLVQHFLKDVYLGAVMGVAIALFWYYLQTRWQDMPDHWLNRSLLSGRKAGKTAQKSPAEVVEK